MEYQPRSSTSERDFGPVTLFDNHLKYLNDSYLNFFTERRRVEETYMELLNKLHRKVKSIDGYLDDRHEPSTTRRAWGEIRDSVERDVQARAAFVSSLTVDVINPLITLKDTQERTRKRIREDLKNSNTAYDEHTTEVLPRLKTKYQRKHQEVEEQKKSPVPSPASPTAPGFTNVPQPEPGSPPRPLVTSPQPLRALDRRPSAGATGGAPRNRSPSSSGAFSDLAHQGKRQLNQLRGFLEKNNTVKEVRESLGGKPENHSLRSVRAKREADEADKEYRKAVHYAETLRLRKTKILEAGYNSLGMFIEETSSTLKTLLAKYIDSVVATHTTQCQLYSHCTSLVDAISPEKDTSKLGPQFSRSLALATPEQVYYQHGAIGTCKDLIFGFNLQDYATDKNLHDGQIPRVVRICIREVDKRGLEAEGIYRVSGRLAVVQTMKLNLEKDETAFRFHSSDDICAVASLLKAYLRETPEPVFRFSLQDRLQHTEDLADHKSNNFALIRSRIRRLPSVHQATLKAIVEHLARVAAHNDKNKMNASNLAIVFAAVLFGEDEQPKAVDLLTVGNLKDTLMVDLINNAHIIFDDVATGQPGPPAQSGQPGQPGQLAPPQSNPLPATPAGEAPAPTWYGSQHTRVASMPATPQGPSQLPPQDFTPQMPTHPAKSIHPSARMMPPPSPSKERFMTSPLSTPPWEKEGVYFPHAISTDTSGGSNDGSYHQSTAPHSPLKLSPVKDEARDTPLATTIPTTTAPERHSSVPTVGENMESDMDPFTVKVPDVPTPPADTLRS